MYKLFLCLKLDNTHHSLFSAGIVDYKVPFFQGICDGACALVLASEDACKQHNLTPLARLVSYGIAGVDPSIMGIGPAPAIKKALKFANKELKDMSLVEVRGYCSVVNIDTIQCNVILVMLYTLRIPRMTSTRPQH